MQQTCKHFLGLGRRAEHKMETAASELFAAAEAAAAEASREAKQHDEQQGSGCAGRHAHDTCTCTCTCACRLCSCAKVKKQNAMLLCFATCSIIMKAKQRGATRSIIAKRSVAFDPCVCSSRRVRGSVADGGLVVLRRTTSTMLKSIIVGVTTLLTPYNHVFATTSRII